MVKLAINGAKKLRETPFPAYQTIADEEKSAVLDVLESGKLSTFLGAWHDDFYGGEQVQLLEREWADYFQVKHAISVNSCTSGLYAAIGAIGIEPGDEVIVPPYTMSASVTAPLIYGAIPVFADIDQDTFCISPQSVKDNITKKTKAIVAVDLFGHPYDADAIRQIAKENNLRVIEDTAQAPGVNYGKDFTGTLGDIGVFSLNYHKHIHCGEGGIVVTNNDDYAQKVRMIRNHAEAVIGGKGHSGPSELVNMLGYNFRMTEIQASITREQIKKLPRLLRERTENVRYIEKRIKDIPAIELPYVQKNCSHAYYLHAIKFNSDHAEGIHRDLFVNAIKAELPKTILRDDSECLISYGYTKPLYLLPMFQEKIAFGKNHYPFNLTDRSYQRGLCPVTEQMHFRDLFHHEHHRPGMLKSDMDDVCDAFFKVWENRHELVTEGSHN